MDFTILHFAIHIVWRANVICTCRKSGIARKTTVAYPELRLGKWTINVELDASRPAALNIIHSDNPVHFSYGKESPTLNGVLYPREHSMSSLLYDETGGEYKVVEVIDQLPASTRIAR